MTLNTELESLTAKRVTLSRVQITCESVPVGRSRVGPPQGLTRFNIITQQRPGGRFTNCDA